MRGRIPPRDKEGRQGKIQRRNSQDNAGHWKTTSRNGTEKRNRIRGMEIRYRTSESELELAHALLKCVPPRVPPSKSADVPWVVGKSKGSEDRPRKTEPSSSSSSSSALRASCRRSSDLLLTLRALTQLLPPAAAAAPAAAALRPSATSPLRPSATSPLRSPSSLAR